MRVKVNELERWRSTPLERVLRCVAEHCKEDRTYFPRGEGKTSRWHASIDGQDFELLITSAKFWDSRAQVGGGGAVDFVMHVTGDGFAAATGRLRRLGL